MRLTSLSSDNDQVNFGTPQKMSKISFIACAGHIHQSTWSRTRKRTYNIGNEERGVCVFIGAWILEVRRSKSRCDANRLKRKSFEKKQVLQAKTTDCNKIHAYYDKEIIAVYVIENCYDYVTHQHWWVVGVLLTHIVAVSEYDEAHGS